MSPLDPPSDVTRAEGDLAALESKLSSEVVRLQQAAESARTRLQQLRGEASELQFQGADPSLLKKMQALSFPSLEVGPAVQKAHAARASAVQARSWAAEQVKSLTAAYAEELSRLSAQLETSAQEVSAHRAQAETRRREEASRATPPPPPRPPAPPPGLQPSRGGAQAKEPRRGKGRVKMQAAIDLRSDSNFFTGFSTNLSEGGVFVATVNLLPLGSEIDLQFSLPSGQAVEVRGVVRWTREVNDRTPDVFPGMGVQFQSLPEPAVMAIRQFVATREPMFFPD